MSRVFSAQVKGGVIVADGVDLPEGTTVTVVVDDGETYGLTPDEVGELRRRVDASDRGVAGHVSAPDLFARLAARS